MAGYFMPNILQKIFPKIGKHFVPKSTSMQNSLECPVCVEVFDDKERVPKTLSCGHCVCESCATRLLSETEGSSITCPECRAKCEGDVSKLPINFPVARLVDALCSECLERPHSDKCTECSLQACGVCMKTHLDMSAHAGTDDVVKFTKLVEEMKTMINDDNDFESIQQRGDHEVENLTKDLHDKIWQLTEEHKHNVAKVQDKVVQNTTILMEWRGKVGKLIAESRMLFRKQDNHFSSNYDVDRENRAKWAEMMYELADSKPLDELDANTITTDSSPSGLTCENNLDVNEMADDVSAAKVTKRKPNVCINKRLNNLSISRVAPTIPNYNGACYKAIFDHFLDNPWYVCAAGSDGNLVFSDWSRNKVIVLKDSLKLDHIIRGEFNGPCGVLCIGTAIFVSDYRNNRIFKIYEDKRITQYNGTKDFRYPCGLSVDSKSQLYIADSYNRRIKVTDKNLNYKTDFGQNIFKDEKPCYIAISIEDNVAVTTDIGNIHIFDSMGAHIRTIKGKSPPHHINARGIAFDNHGYLLVSDRDGGRVVAMTETGEVRSFVGSPGSGQGQLKEPMGLALTRTGDIVVCDAGNKRVQLFEVE